MMALKPKCDRILTKFLSINLLNRSLKIGNDSINCTFPTTQWSYGNEFPVLLCHIIQKIRLAFTCPFIDFFLINPKPFNFLSPSPPFPTVSDATIFNRRRRSSLLPRITAHSHVVIARATRMRALLGEDAMERGCLKHSSRPC